MGKQSYVHISPQINRFMRKLDKNLVEFSFRVNTLAEFGGKTRHSSGLLMPWLLN